MKRNEMSRFFQNFSALDRTFTAKNALVGRFFIITDSHGHFILNVYARENAFRIWVHHALKFILSLIILVHKFDLDDESEGATLMPLWLADDVAAKFADQLTTDVQPKSNSARVDFFRFLEKPIHFKEFLDVFLSDTDASVGYTNLQKVAWIIEMAQRIR